MVRILVVDDEVHLRELMQKVLSGKGYAVTTVPTADQALAMAFREPFDLIILDIQLGADSGLTVLKSIREKNAKIPVVIYSGCVTPELETEARSAGATEVLRKDIGVQALAQQIETIVAARDRIAEGISVPKDLPVLIVDDQEKIRNLLKTFFESKGYRVVEASDGDQALAVVEKQAVAAVLLDIEMPGRDGLSTLPELFKINPKLGVVMATGVQDDDKVQQAIAAGAYGYVLKPFDFLYLELVVLSRLAIARGG